MATKKRPKKKTAPRRKPRVNMAEVYANSANQTANAIIARLNELQLAQHATREAVERLAQDLSVARSEPADLTAKGDPTDAELLS